MVNKDPAIPDYIKKDLLRMMSRIAANEHWYKQFWLGVPIWQMPEDLLRLQEIIVDIKPKWIIETGTKFGGSAIFFASLLQLIGQLEGGVITVDLVKYEKAVEVFDTHACASLVIKSIIGDASSKEVVNEITQVMSGREGKTLVFLDDNHNADHVYREMKLYSKLVTPGSYLIVADTVFEDLSGTPVGASTDKYPDVKNSNPRVAINKFLSHRQDFSRDEQFFSKGLSNFSDGFLFKKYKI